jgi:cytochrome c
MSVYRRLFAVAAAVMVPAAFAAAPKPDIENGKTTFSQLCGICHSVEKSGGPIMGPTLLGIVGRKAAAVADFPLYTPALKASKITWNARSLEEFLENPGSKVPGTTMPTNISDARTRADVIAYLATLK